MIAKNFFRDGMIMDLAPDNTQNSLLTNALNATFVTFNGNELSLQNDMGNARVETAMLPEGYIPIGSTELGGIIYIAAYNPFNKKCLLGSFPSPERNLEKEEIAPDSFEAMLKAETFQAIDENKEPTGELLTTLHKIDLGMPILHPGDKFYVCADIITELVADKSIWNGTEGYVDIYLATINSENKIVKLELSEKSSGHVIGEAPIKNGNNYDIDSYRKTIQSDYDVYTAKESGKLYIIAELVTIDDFEVATKIEKTQVTWNFKTTSKYGVKPDNIKISAYYPDYGANRIPITRYKEFYVDYSIENISKEISDELINLKGEYKITYTPVMPFGELKNLSTTLILYYNTVEKTDISEWRYYNTDEYINLRFTINSSETSNNLTLSFYSLTGDFEESPSFTITYNNLFSVSKNYTEIIYLDKDYNTNYFLGILNKNKFYKVSIKLGDNELILYLYTCPIFNGFYESLSYYINSEVHEEPLYNFNLINSTYGYEENGDKIYPLQFTLKSNFESNIFGLSITNELVSGLDKLILSEATDSNSVEYKYTLEVKDAYKAYLSLESDWGGMFRVEKSTLEINPTKEGIENSEEITNSTISEFNNILTVITEVTNTATLNYYLDTVSIYKFKPLVYDELTANQYGITLQEGTDGKLYTRSTLGNYPMWYFFSENNESNKDFLSASFIPNWGSGTAIDIFNKNNIGNASYKYLNMYNVDAILNAIKNVINDTSLTIVPHLFAFWETGNTCKLFIIDCVNTTINDNFIVLTKYMDNNGEEHTGIYYTKDDADTLYLYSVDKIKMLENGILFDDNVSRIEESFIKDPRIWSFVMKDEEGKYRPVNCFMIHSAISDGYNNSFSNCVSIGEKSESMMKLVLDMLMSIYKISETTIENQFVGLANDVSLSNNTVDLNLAYSKITMNIPKKQNINNLNYDLPTETNSTYKYIITDSKNDVVDKISEVNTLYKCELDGNIVEVPNIDPNLLYYKIIDQTETTIKKLHLMDKNFVWNNSSTLSTNDGIILVEDPKIILQDIEDIVIKLSQDSNINIFSGKYEPEKPDGSSQLISINKINIHISAHPEFHETEGGSFSGTPTLRILNKGITIYKKLLNPINEIIIPIDKSRAAELKPEIKPSFYTYTETLNDLDISFNEESCEIQLSGLTTEGSVNIMVTLDGVLTIIPAKIVPNTGIGEYLTLKDGKLCLKSNLVGTDRSIKINAGGPDYITDWKFNSKIQFKNEFAI